MQDIARVKRNVSKMIDMGAPETDIDAYLFEEGTTPEALRAYRVESPQKPENYAEKSWADVGSEALSNVPDSAMNMLGDIWQAVSNPVDTGKAIAGLTTNDVKDLIVSRYGDVESFKRTLATDPVGVAGDLSTLLGGAGALARGAGATGKLARAGKIASTAAKFTDPTNVIAAPIGFSADGVGAVSKGIAKRFAPERLYASAIKIPPSTPRADVLSQVETGLTNKITPTADGAEKLRGMMKNLRGKVDATIDAGQARGDFIDLVDTTRGLDDIRQAERITGGKTGSIDALEENFLAANAGDGPSTIGVRQAQDIKDALSKKIDDKEWQAKTPQVKVQGQQALYRGLMTELEDLYPEVKLANKENKRLIDLNKSIQRALNRIENTEPVGLGSLAAAGAGGAAAGPAGMAGGFLSKVVLEIPEVKARLAFLLADVRNSKAYRSAVVAGKIGKKASTPIRTTGGRMGLYQTGRVANDQDEFRGR